MAWGTLAVVEVGRGGRDEDDDESEDQFWHFVDVCDDVVEELEDAVIWHLVTSQHFIVAW